MQEYFLLEFFIKTICFYFYMPAFVWQNKSINIIIYCPTLTLP